MHRRRFLTSTALALCGATLRAADRTRLSIPNTAALLRETRSTATRAFVLVPARVSWERVVRTSVGLRPRRDSGFVLKAQRFDDKTVIHNYGHGGAGMSLAWGTGAIAADMALTHRDRHAAVLGCGSPGLTVARQLQRRGFQVTIYTKTVPPETTSNMSLAAFTPASGLVDEHKRTRAWDRQFRVAAEISYRELGQLVGRHYGVYWIDQFAATDDPDGRAAADNDGGLVPDGLRSAMAREILGPGEHPFPTPYAIRSRSLNIEPRIYLDRLVADFLAAGGRIVIRAFDTPHDLMTLRERVIVNSTGLGSLTLFNDRELVPVKGQLTLLLPQPDVRYRVSSRVATPDGETLNVSMNPRSDGIVIGNLQERGSWSLDPVNEVRERNVNAAIQFFAAMRERIDF